MEDYFKRILKVLIFIEDHIEDELSMECLARVACYSPFHFHRIFQAIVGESVHQYIRRLRLEKAAGRLLYGDESITEIALDAQYETPSAFTKAFKQCMGASPNNYRRLKKEMDAMTKKVNNLPMINPDKIEDIKEIPLLFIRRTGEYMTSADKAWKAMYAFIEEKGLDKSKLRYFSISRDDPNITNVEKLRFDACIEAQRGIQEQGEISRQVLKGGKYAIFTHQGPYAGLKAVFDQIFIKWFPESMRNFDENRVVFCELFNIESIDKDESKLMTKIYIPIV